MTERLFEQLPRSAKVRCTVCGRTGFPQTPEHPLWQAACYRGHAPMRCCGRIATVLLDGTPRAHTRRPCTTPAHPEPTPPRHPPGDPVKITRTPRPDHRTTRCVVDDCDTTLDLPDYAGISSTTDDDGILLTHLETHTSDELAAKVLGLLETIDDLERAANTHSTEV